MRLKRLIIFAALALVVAAPAHADYNSAGMDRYIHARDWNGALAYAQAWTKAQPNDVVGWYNLGQVYLLPLKQPANAVGPFQRAVQLRPDVGYLQYGLGAAYLRSGQAGAAIAPLQKATAEEPTNILYWIMLGNAENAAKQYQAEDKVLQQGERAAGAKSDYAGWYDLGLQYETLHDYPNAIHAYRQSVRLKPNFGEGWNSLGVTERDASVVGGGGMGMAQQAEKDLQQAVALGTPHAAENLADTRAVIAGTKTWAQVKAQMAPYENHLSNCRITGHDYSGYGPCP